jgi:hypothetical protein
MISLAVVVTLNSSFAQEKAEVMVHGFVSQGYLLSSANNYLADSEEGSAEFNEAALNVAYLPTTRFRLGLQFLSRDMGDEGNHKIVLDWGYGDYRWRDDLGIRVGKIKQPLGLYNKNRDLDLLRTSVLLPQGIYNDHWREFVMAVEGVGLYGFKPLGIFGDADYEVQFGSRNVPDPDAGFWGTLYSAIGTGIADYTEGSIQQNPYFPPGSVKVDYLGTDDQSIVSSTSINTNLIWNTPLTGLRLGAVWAGSYDLRVSGITEMSIEIPTGDPSQPTYKTTNKIPFESTIDVGVHTLSGEFTSHGWTIGMEYFRLTGSETIIADTASVEADFDNMSWYGKVGYQVTPWLALGTYYSEFYIDPSDKDGKKKAIPEEAWQKDLTVSSRFDISPFWIAKLEVHFIDGIAQVIAPDGEDDRERNWTLLAVKNTFHF